MSDVPIPTHADEPTGVVGDAAATTTRHATVDQVDGAAILDALLAALTRYVILPSTETADAVALWIAASHAQPAWEHAPRLVIKAPEKRCGKSRLLDVIEATCHDPLITVNASESAVYRSITDDPPTLLVDEADTIFGAKVAESSEALRGLLNAGHQRNRPAKRYDASSRSVETLQTFAMAALAGIGSMPDTIEDRAVIVKMRRRAPGETVAPYRNRRDRPALRQLATNLATWLRPDLGELEHAEPDMPIEDRAADTWEPLIVVADHAGGTWPERARHAAKTLTEEALNDGNTSTRVRLITDCRLVFGDDTALPSSELLDRLKADPEMPWAEYGPNGLTPKKLGELLREFDIRSANHRFDGKQSKGYQRNDFLDAWSRYCPTDTTRPGLPSHPSQAHFRWSGWDGLPSWDASIRPTGQNRAEHEHGTDGTATLSKPVCIRCREPLDTNDGTNTHPQCRTGAA